jgi:hypothetical protein
MSGFENFLFGGMLSDSLRGNRPWRNDKINDRFEVNGTKIVVDTCCSSDTERWETGINRSKGDWEGAGWEIVQTYDSREEAEKGHKAWVEDLKKKPNQDLTEQHRKNMKDWTGLAVW